MEFLTVLNFYLTSYFEGDDRSLNKSQFTEVTNVDFLDARFVQAMKDSEDPNHYIVMYYFISIDR